ncbi:hypothetical protein CCP4SC76_7960001 [Gammaproteobacteria bacterium]
MPPSAATTRRKRASHQRMKPRRCVRRRSSFDTLESQVEKKLAVTGQAIRDKQLPALMQTRHQAAVDVHPIRDMPNPSLPTQKHPQIPLLYLTDHQSHTSKHQNLVERS